MLSGALDLELCVCVLAWDGGITSSKVWRIQSLCFGFFPMLALLYIWDYFCVNVDYFYLSVFAAAELQCSLFHLYPAGQIEWKQDSPQGEPRLAQPVLLKGHSRPQESDSACISSSRGDGDCSCHADCVYVKEREWVRVMLVQSSISVSHRWVCCWGRKWLKVKFRH